MSITLDSLLPELRPWAPGVSDQAAYKGLRGAAIELCERTRLWKWESTIAVLSTDPSTFTVALPTGAALHDVEVAMYDGRELTPMAARDVDEKFHGWSTGDLGTGLPEVLTQVVQDTLTLVPAPSADGSLYLRLRLKPSQSAQILPDFMREYAECLGWGALGRILTVPGQSFSNPDLATFYTQRFIMKLDALATKGTKGQQAARKRTRPSYY